MSRAVDDRPHRGGHPGPATAGHGTDERGAPRLLDLAVVTVVRGRHEALRHQQAALARWAPEVHKIVVTMGDPDVATLCRPYRNVQVVDLPMTDEALPLARARNVGAETALRHGAQALIFLDVDCLPGPDLVAAYERGLRQVPGRALLCGPVTYLAPGVVPGSAQELAAVRDPHRARPDPTGLGLVADDRFELFWSLSFAIGGDAWTDLNGFDTAFTGYGAEDTDLALRARGAGFALWWVEGADAFHQHHSVEDPPIRHLDDILRNGATFAARHGFWPMGGWLAAFAERGLVERRGGTWRRAEAQRAAWDCPPAVAAASWARTAQHAVERAEQDGPAGQDEAVRDLVATWDREHRRVVVVGAHPDDETIGAGRLLSSLQHPRVAVVLTAGESCYGPDAPDSAAREVADRRLSEWQQACAMLGLETLDTPRFCDGELARQIPACIEVLGGVIEPGDLVVTLWRHDPHPDHAAASSAVRQVAAALGAGVVEFPVWAPYWMTPGQVGATGHRFAVYPADQLAETRREAALACYPSQFEVTASGQGPVVPADLLDHHRVQWIAVAS